MSISFLPSGVTQKVASVTRGVLGDFISKKIAGVEEINQSGAFLKHAGENKVVIYQYPLDIQYNNVGDARNSKPRERYIVQIDVKTPMEYEGGQILNKDLDKREQTTNGKIDAHFFLPMPNRLPSFDNELSFASEDMGIVAGVMGSSLGSATENAIGKMLNGEVISSVTGLFNDVGNTLGQHGATTGTSLIHRAATRKVDEYTGTKIMTKYNKDSGTAFNEFTETIFKGVGIRKFDFTWTFSPRSDKEAMESITIIKAFRFYSMPTRTDSGTKWKYPSQFNIGFKILNTEKSDGVGPTTMLENIIDNPHIPKIGTCWMTSFSTNLNEQDVFAAFKGGLPVKFSMAMTLTEDKPHDRTDIEKGY